MKLQEHVTKYELVDAPGLEGLGFTESSDKYLSQPGALNFAANKGPGIVLASALEDAAFRIVAQGKDNANDYQRTRTGALYVKIDGKWYCAVDDTPDASKNIVIARAQEGFNAHNSGKQFLLSKDDALVKEHLNRAELSDRVFEVPQKTLELSTQQRKGKSEFGQDKRVQAFFGQISEPYAGWLNGKEYSHGYVWLLNPSDLEKNVKNDQVEVRPVGLGDGYFIIYGIGAVSRFNYNGRARGVRGAREFSTGKEALVGAKK